MDTFRIFEFKNEQLIREFKTEHGPINHVIAELENKHRDSLRKDFKGSEVTISVEAGNRMVSGNAITFQIFILALDWNSKINTSAVYDYVVVKVN